MNSLTVHEKLDSLPENLQQQVADFIDFLMERYAVKTTKTAPQTGSAKGKIRMAAGFDAPLDDFKDYM